MKYKVGIIHGAGGDPSMNWFPWLAAELEARGHEIVVPSLPGLEEQNLSSWRDEFSAEYGELTSKSILIGHSIGCALILNLLNESRTPIRAAFLAAGFIGSLGNATYDPPNASFFGSWLNLDHIRTMARAWFVYCGDNDPYVPSSKGSELAAALGTKPIIVEGAGHLNYEWGYRTFPAVVRDFDHLNAMV